jgi:CheY-like chemotaxis protein
LADDSGMRAAPHDSGDPPVVPAAGHDQAVADLAAIVASAAHDLNNSLLAIRGYAELMLSHLDEGDPLHRDAVEINEAADGASAVANRLLALGRRHAAVPEAQTPVDERTHVDSLEGRETVLVVEDEEMVRTLARRMLEGSGYSVLIASTPGEALRACKQYQGEIDLIVTDVVMPQMSGGELAARLAELRPGTPILFMSGYADDAIGHRGVLDDGIAFLQKPFSGEALARKVREVLDARRGG